VVETLTPRMPMMLRQVADGVPRPTATCPSSGSSAPAMIFSRVDLPAPFGPVSPTRAPSGTVHDTSSKTIWEP
jgi:hypothetical protein